MYTVSHQLYTTQREGKFIIIVYIGREITITEHIHSRDYQLLGTGFGGRAGASGSPPRGETLGGRGGAAGASGHWDGGDTGSSLVGSWGGGGSDLGRGGGAR